MKRTVRAVVDWVLIHLNRLHDIREKPEAVAGGMAIGMFFGFTPFVGLKTLSSVLCAYVCRCSIAAAVIAVTLHDLFIPVAPFLIRWEYDVGYWILAHPHHFPPDVTLHEFSFHAMFHWKFFFDVGRPLLLGSTIFGGVAAVVTYCGVHIFLLRRRARLAALAKKANEEDADI